MLGNRWPHKPPFGYLIDDEHPLARGLVAFWPLNEGSGPTARDIVGGVKLALAASNTSWGAGSSGGIVCTGTNAGLSVAAPAALQLPLPLSFAYGARSVASLSAGVIAAGVTSTGGSQGWQTYWNGYPTLDSGSYIGGSDSITNLGSSVTGQDDVCVGSLASGLQSYYRGGKLAATASASGAISYALPYVRLGSTNSTNAGTGVFYWLGIWNRALAATEALTLMSGGPWQMFTSRRLFTAPYLSISHSYTLTGPASGFVGIAAPFTVATPELETDTIALSDGGQGGTISPTSLTFSNSATAQDFTYTPASGILSPTAITITLTSEAGYPIGGSPFTFLAKPTAVNYTLTVPSPSAYVGIPSSFALASQGAIDYTESVSLSDGNQGGTFRNSSGTVVTSFNFTDTTYATTETFTYTPASSGAKTITLVSAYGGSITNDLFVFTSVTAISFTLAGPATGPGLATASGFTVAPAQPTNDTVTLSDGAGGTFTPSSFTFTTGSASAQDFTYTPTSVGPKTITATSADGATISTFLYSPIPTAGSLHFTGQCYLSTSNGATALSSQPSAGVMYRVQFNNAGGGLANAVLIEKASSNLLAFDGVADITVTLGLVGHTVTFSAPFQIGTPNHVLISTKTGQQLVVVNGTTATSFAYTANTLAYSGPLVIGMQSAMSCDFQISDFAVWDNYAPTLADAQALYTGVQTSGTCNPLTLIGSGTNALQQAATWLPLSGTINGHPNVSGDLGLEDWGMAAGTSGSCSLTTVAGGSAENAAYAAALGFTPPVEVAAYIGKSGQTALFFPVATTPTANGYYAPQIVTGVVSNPTITWNGETISIGPPVWSQTNKTFPWVAYLLQCGGVNSVGITSGGTGYTGVSDPPTIAVTGGTGTTIVAPTFGAVSFATGIVSYTLGGVGAYGQYTTAPTAKVSGGTYTTPPAATLVYTSGTSISIAPTAGGVLGCGSGVTIAPTITLSGGVGAGATAIAAMTGGIASLTIGSGGTGYSTGNILVSITDSDGGTGAGATATATAVSGVITAITVTNPGANYTSPVVTITGTGGSSATVTAIIWKSGGITQPLVTAGGSGYTTAGTTVSFSGGGGSGAAATAIIANGVVTGIIVTDVGASYTSAPTIAITCTGASGATATCTYCKSGGIAAVAITSSSSAGYAAGTTTVIATDTAGGTGSGATFGFTLNATGGVTAIAPTASGTGYTAPVVVVQPGSGSGAAITVSVASTSAGGSGATATATVSGGTVTALSITGGGSGYTSAPPATIYGGGTGATITLTVSGGQVTGYSITGGGSGYTSTPTVLIGDPLSTTVTGLAGGSGYGLGTTAVVVDPTGSGAILSVTVNPATNEVTGVAVSSVGGGYTNPTVVFIDGAQAAVTANISQYIASVAVETPGSGYASPPTITATGGGASTAAVLTPVMSGVSSGDVLTYSAAWSWLQTAIGSAAQATSASIANSVGSLEGPSGLLAGLPTERTFRLGLDMGNDENYAEYSTCTQFANRVKTASQWNISTGGGLQLTFDGQPYSWASPSATLTNYVYWLSLPNPIDGKETPGFFGVGGEHLTWTILYYDPNYYAADQATVGLSFLGPYSLGAVTTMPFGSSVTGRYVCITYPIAYETNPTSWVITVLLSYASPIARWTISDLFVIAPGNDAFVTAYLANPAAANQLALDNNVVQWITTTTKRQVPAVMRLMDVNNATGGASNVVDPGDLNVPSNFSWSQLAVQGATPNPPNTSVDLNGNPILNGSVTFTSYRAFNTNPALAPGGATPYYNWPAQTKIYSEQLGSYSLGSDSFGPYIPLAAADMGSFVRGGFGNNSSFLAIELLTAGGQPHGYKTGQYFSATSSIPNVPVISSDGLHTLVSPNAVGYYTFQAFVTGPDSVMILAAVDNSGPAATVSQVNSPVPIDCNLTTTINVPYGNGVPFAGAGALGSAVGTNVWISIPPFATDATSLAIAQAVAANLTPGLKVFVEYGNEAWNTNSWAWAWCWEIGNLVAYMPSGTPIGPYYVTNGSALSSEETYTLLAARHHAIWYDYFASIGRPDDVVRTFGSQFSGPSETSTVVQTATTYGIPMDYVHVAPYPNGLQGGTAADTPIVTACSPAGSIVTAGSPGNWPVPAIVDLIRQAVYYHPAFWSFYAEHIQYVSMYGQPVAALPTPTVYESESSGGPLPAGSYYVSCTFVDAEGRETTTGNSQVLATVVTSGGNTPTLAVQLPLVPTTMPGGTINVYLSLLNQLPASQTLYASGIASGTLFPLSVGPWTTGSSQSPPLTNGVPLTYPPPQMIAYEFTVQQYLQNSTPFQVQLARDIFYHPSAYDLNTALYLSLQSGHPGVANSGLVLGCFFQLAAQWATDGSQWALAVSTSQSPGYGASNLYSTAQGGAPGDNLAHDISNEAPLLQSFRDWLDATAPPTPTVTTVPASGAILVSISSPVVATFNEAIQPQTLDFTIAPTAGGSNVAGTVMLDPTETIATFYGTQSGGFANGTGYTGSIQATGQDGVPMPSPYTWSWTTTYAPPTGAGVIPGIGYQFNGPIVATNMVISVAISASQATVSGTTSYNPGTYLATFTPASPFEVGTKYIATISGATASDGTAMTPVTFVFTPGPAKAGGSWFAGLGKSTVSA